MAICAPEDVTSPHVSVADEFVVLEKGATAIAPYLDIEELTKVAVECGVDFVHPGEWYSIHMFVCFLLHIEQCRYIIGSFYQLQTMD